MKDLESLCTRLKWHSVKTHLQTGNVIFSAKGSRVQLEHALEAAINSHFSFPIPVVVRTADAFSTLIKASPFTEEAAETPSKVLLYLSKEPIAPGASDHLKERARAAEAVFVQDESLWIHFPKGVGSSKLTPAVIDRAVGSNATGRNWNTVTKLQQLCFP